jgi:hypothetical protein
MKRSKTNKLFYGRYPYKISCEVLGAYLIVREGIEETKDICNNIIKPHLQFWYDNYWKKNIDKSNLSAFAKSLEPFVGKDLKFRTEGRIFDIYCLNREIFEKLEKNLSEWIREITEPNSKKELEFLTNSGPKKIVCQKLPHGKFQYRVYVRYKTDIAIRIKFKNWIDQYGDKVRLPGQTYDWFTMGNRWAWTPNFYVEDSATLSMVGIFLGNAIQKIEEFVPRSNINSSND